MVVGLKDGLKLIGISVVSCCAVFVCTFMLNYYIDVLPLKDALTDQGTIQLYNAQIATAKLTSSLAGGVLSIISVLMLIFYIKLYIDSHSAQLGIVKALGYSRGKIASKFWVFGLSVFAGCAVGFGLAWAIMKTIYKNMTIEGVEEITANFHIELLFALVVVPTLLFIALSCLYAYFALNRPVFQLVKGGQSKVKVKENAKAEKDRPFLLQMAINTVNGKKSLAFFVAFAAFCFSAMIQMGISMKEFAAKTMGNIILVIGLVIAIVTAFMAITTLINSNKKNISVMKAFGYSVRACAVCVLGGYVPIALIGFAVGTVYQYGLLKIMLSLVFKEVEYIPDYTFDVKAFFITLFLFIISYLVLLIYYTVKINKISVKEVMTEN